MKNKAEIEQEVLKTLQCFEQRERIAPRPFFATRVMAKISRLEDAQQARSRRLAFGLGYLRPALLTLIVVLNIVSALIVFRGTPTPTPAQTTARAQYLTAFADEYALSQPEYDTFLAKK